MSAKESESLPSESMSRVPNEMSVRGSIFGANAPAVKILILCGPNGSRCVRFILGAHFSCVAQEIRTWRIGSCFAKE